MRRLFLLSSADRSMSLMRPFPEPIVVGDASGKSSGKSPVEARFFNEARAANAILHPGIVRIFDCGFTESGVAYLSMEYLEGESLRTRLARERQLPTQTALRIARQIASALAAAHRAHIIHRDVKPDNIMLVPDPDFPGGERVKILDFGIAKMAQSPGAQPLRTKSDVLMGTPTYMAPEQCRGAKLATDRSDVYSLGVILYQMLAGYPPFLGASMGELIAMHLMDEPHPLSDVIPTLPPKISRLTSALLAKKPSGRPSMERAQKLLLRLEEESELAPPSPAIPRAEPASSSDSERATADLPQGAVTSVADSAKSSAAQAATARASYQVKALPSIMMSDSRHVHIPKRTLHLLVGSLAASALFVTVGILWGVKRGDSPQQPAPVRKDPDLLQKDPAPTPEVLPARSPDDPLDPLRTAEDYILQGGYRRAMDLSTQFGRQDPLRAWEIYGRAACGLRLVDHATRALRELQQRHQDKRIESLLSYCRLHKLPLPVAESP